MLRIEIVYMPSARQTVHLTLDLQVNATVKEALIQSELFNQYPEARALKIGIFSQQVNENTRLKNGDRIELYRPLVFDPKDNRRQRAQKPVTRKNSDNSF